MEKPRILFCSAGEAVPLMDELAALVTKDWALPKCWNAGVFGIGESFLESLLSVLNDVQFAVVLCTPEDTLNSRGASIAAPRDNLIFELGLAISRLGTDRVALVCPESPDIRIPSDYHGRTLSTYDPTSGRPAEYLFSAGHSIKVAFRDIWITPSLESVIEPHQDAAIVKWQTQDRIIPIYRDLAASMNWFSDFERYMTEVRNPYLPSRMLYYGPGLADYWLSNASSNAANTAQTKAFEKTFSQILRTYLPETKQGPDIAIIDLGIGDFSKGNMVLEELLRRGGGPSLRYIALDVSFEMVASALSAERGREAKTLLELRQQSGHVVGINALFEQLRSYQHLFCSAGNNLFLLLGNTLGNELSEEQTLNDIAVAMRPGDLLITEIQLKEEDPFTDEELTASIQSSVEFYAGPFLALGCSPAGFDLVVKRDKRAEAQRDIDALTYEVMCRFKRPVAIERAAFARDNVAIPATEIPVYVVRKYSPKSLDAQFRGARLETLESIITGGRSRRSRRFCHIVARKKD